MPIEPSYDFDTFNTMGATNGSGVELTDTWEDFRKKTNGIINRLEDFGVAPIAQGLLSWHIGSGGAADITLSNISLRNGFNIRSYSFSTSTGFTVNFKKPSKDAYLIPHGTLSARDDIISPMSQVGTSAGVDKRNRGDIGTVVFHTPTINSISFLPFVATQDNASRAYAGMYVYKSLGFLIYGAL